MPFDRAFAEAAAQHAEFERFQELHVGFAADHPAIPSPEARRASWDRKSNSMFAGASLDYDAFIGERWDNRVAAVADATRRALATIPKTRLTPVEQSVLTGLIEPVCASVSALPPATLMPLRSLFVLFDAAGNRIGMRFGDAMPHEANTPGGDEIEVRPEDLHAYLTQNPSPGGPPAPIKLYRRIGGVLHYREAWVDGEQVVEHVGVCGERGTITETLAPGRHMQQKVLDRIAATARAEGFRRIADDRLAVLVVSCPIEGFGSLEHLARRHALEAFLNDVTGWHGLGHCDGGSIGSGSMEACCLVVDAKIAIPVISRELATSPFADFTVGVMPQ